MRNWSIYPVLALAAITLTGCWADPAEECLDSFKMTLKDPESGRVIAFENNKLTYTATNAYGARVQSTATCKEVGGKWARDTLADEVNEIMGGVDREISRLQAKEACIKSGKRDAECEIQSRVGRK